MRKRLMCIILGVVCVISLISCENNDTKDSETESANKLAIEEKYVSKEDLEKLDFETGKEIQEYGVNEKIEGDYDKSLAVECNNGIFVGYKKGDIIAHKGIPYAEAPIGKRRWKPPVLAKDKKDVFKSYYFGKVCSQEMCATERACNYKQGEDCLTLNVWTNGKNKDNKKPVMVFIHGGGYIGGGTADPLYDATNFTKRHDDIVVVTINYRLGILGFLDLTGLEGGKSYKKSGNLGVLDQICALKWINKNISAFGGNPKNVTIVGESAGGGCVSLLPLMQESKGLFQRVICQSGSVCLTQKVSKSRNMAKIVMKQAKVNSVSELAKLSEKKLHGIVSNLGMDTFAPERDGEVLPKDLYTAYEKENFKDIEFLIGTNQDEYRYWIEVYGSYDEYKKEMPILYDRIINTLSNKKKEIVKKFLDSQSKQTIWNKTEFLNEYIFRIPAIAQAEQISKKQGKVYMYYWKYPHNSDLLACHATELGHIFGNMNNKCYDNSKKNTKFSNDVQDMWANFVRDGDPSIKSYTWNKYDTTDRKTTILNDDIHEEKDPLSKQRKILMPLVSYGYDIE